MAAGAVTVGLDAVPVAAAVAVTLTLVQGGGGGSGTPDDTASGRDYLLAAAEKVEATGDYWYQEEQTGTLHQVSGGYVVDRRQTSRQWLAEGADLRWSQSMDNGTGPASDADERAWKAAGSPTQWTLPEEGGGGVVRQESGGVVQQDAPGGGVDIMPIGGLETDQLDGLPTEPDALRERLAELARAKLNAADDDLRGIVVRQAVEIAVRLPADADLRAAVYRLLSQEPGVRDLGVVQDRSGRAGQGVAVPFDDGHAELRLVLDPSTGALLGTLTATTRAFDGWDKGAVTAYTTTVEQSWTDVPPPPFDDDLET
ncbi:CU044_5270 family protein [Streptomyces sp. NPDC056716]|uniref:CU044_5270 family protein n=1 Tax=unclassified Streptomyces TaxID=2593676 RepID=UPI00369BD44E